MRTEKKHAAGPFLRAQGYPAGRPYNVTVRVPRWVVLVLSLCLAVPAIAEDEGTALRCGQPVTAHLEPGAVDAYRFTVGTGSAALIDAVDTSGTIGLLKVEASVSGETCAGTLALTHPGSTPVKVSDCLGNDSGDYTITSSVVAEGPENCGVALECGATPRVHQFKVFGEVDSYTFSGQKGDRVTLTATDVAGDIGIVRLRIFDPDGVPVSGSDSCASSTRTMSLTKTGTYTALVSACGLPKTGFYGVAFESPSCPQGPDVTYFGIARADSFPLSPTTYDDSGRPMYVLGGGAGFFLVVEARPGLSGAAVGQQAFEYDSNNPSVLPDLQVLMSRSLGDGSQAVCDKAAPHRGGVPGVPSLEFAPTRSVADVVNDFGCRVNDGTGHPLGVGEADACTEFPNGQEFRFVDPTSTLQFCAPIEQPWAFPRGLTIVKARVRDTEGSVGAEREIAVQVGSGQCPGDCNRDLEVTVDELVTGVNIALGFSPLDECAAMDTDKNGDVTVDEIVKAVGDALDGCPVS